MRGERTRDGGNDEVAGLLEGLMKEAFGPGASQGPLPPPPEGSPVGLGARYAIIEVCGTGAMGVVYRVRDEALQRDVAMKVLHERHLHRPYVAQRFLAEARIASQLQHPNIVPVHDVGITSERRPFFTMKLVEGRTLASLLAARSSEVDDQHRWLALLVQVCHGMAYAHARRVVHRDLKPSNIMVGAFGEVMVMDFGMSKTLDERCVVSEYASLATGPGETTHGCTTRSVVGTYAYMPPEQARGKAGAVTARSDVWSLGAILCEILTGAPPYQAASAHDVRSKALAVDLDEARRRIDQCAADSELKAICQHCLESEPERRPTDAGALAERIDAYLASIERRAEEARVGAARLEERARSERRAWRLQRALLVVVALALAAAFVAWIYLDSAQRRRAATVTLGIDQAMAEARQGLEEARRDDEPAPWAAAVSAARRAVSLSQQREADAAARARAAAALAEIEALERAATERRAALRRDDQMRRRLREIEEQHVLRFDHPRIDRDYEVAFRDYGLDLFRAGVPELARAIQASPLRIELVAALDDWRQACALAGTPRQERRQRLREIGQAVDQDPVNRRLRDSEDDNDRLTTLRSLADEQDLAALPAWTLLRLAKQLERAGDANAARRVRQAGLVRDPGDFWLNFFHAASFDASSPSEQREALRYSQAALAAWPESIVAATNLAGVLHGMGHHEEAARILDRALVLHPDNANLHHNLGLLLLRSGQGEAAVRSFRQAVRLDPEDAGFQVSLGQTLRDCGAVAEAQEVLGSAAARWPDDRYTLVAHGVLLCDHLDQPGEAAELFERATVVAPQEPTGFFNLGVARHKLGQLRGALQAFSQALERDPRAASTHDRIARVWHQRGNHRKAKEHWQRAVELAPADAGSWWRLGVVCAETGDARAAIDALEQACKHQPDFADAWLHLSEQRLALGRLAAALQAAETAVKLAPENASMRRQLGFSQLRSGQPDSAIASLKRAIDRQPDDEPAHRQLAAALVEVGDLDAALAQLDAARQLDGNAEPGRDEALVRTMMALAPQIATLAIDPAAETDVLRIVALARLSQRAGRHGVAARLWIRAVELDASQTEALAGGARLRAIDQALTAVAPAAPSNAEAAALLALAREQLQVMVEACLLAPGAAAFPTATEPREALRSLAADPRLAAVCSAASLASMPPAEAAAWRVVWQAIRVLSPP